MVNQFFLLNDAVLTIAGRAFECHSRPAVRPRLRALLAELLGFTSSAAPSGNPEQRCGPRIPSHTSLAEIGQDETLSLSYFTVASALARDMSADWTPGIAQNALRAVRTQSWLSKPRISMVTISMIAPVVATPSMLEPGSRTQVNSRQQASSAGSRELVRGRQMLVHPVQ